jgi:hypothetical protein
VTIPFFGSKDAVYRAQARVIDIFRKSPEEKRAIQDGILLKDANYEDQAFKIGQRQNRTSILHCLNPVRAWLQMEIRSFAAGIVGHRAFGAFNQADRVADHHSPGPLKSPLFRNGAGCQALPHGKDETAFGVLGIGGK